MIITQRRLPARAVVAAVVAAALLAVGAIGLARQDGSPLPARPASERPKLMLVTTLPIMFPEEFSLSANGSRALQALQTRYAVVPIGTTDALELKQARILLMAHPLAQPAEDLVALDRWVRSGGRLLLLADPRLEWPSRRPLGDRLRPPPGFADTGLLAHWGLRLDAPKQTGQTERELAGRTVLAASPGALAGKCDVARDGFVARCAIAKGKATVVADADFLNVDHLGAAAERNLDALLAELSALER